jgi:hypothetical protein
MTISAPTQGIKPGVCTSTNRPSAPFDGQVIYMTDVDQTAVWDGTQWTVLAPIAGGRNAVINGAMNVWQRGTSFNGSFPYYGADRWFFARPLAVAGSTLSRQASGLTGFTYCARMQRDSGNTNTSSVRIFQSLETINSLQFAGKQITVSFYVRSGANYSGGANTYLNVRSGTGTDQQLGNTGFTGVATVGQLAITPTSTWTRYSVTGSVSSSATQVGFDISYTPTGTAGANDYIEITGVQLEAGAVATPFEFEDYGTTLAKCQRYYQKSYNQEITPPTNGQQPGIVVGGATSVGVNALVGVARFPVSMRITPTMTIYSYTTSQLSRVSDAYAGTDQSTGTITVAYQGQNGFSLYNTSGVTLTSQLGLMFHFTASAEL